MINIEYRLEDSDKHGIKFFTDQSISKGAKVYVSGSSSPDEYIDQGQYDSLDQTHHKAVDKWGYFDEESQLWCIDFNLPECLSRSEDATLIQESDHTGLRLIAVRDIKTGEELTVVAH